MAQVFNYNKPSFESPLLSVDVRHNFQALITSNSGNANPPNPVDGMWWLKPSTRELSFRLSGVWQLFATYNVAISQWDFPSASGVSVTAGENIQGGRAVFVAADTNAYKADKGVLAEVRGILGISPGAIMTGTTGLVKIIGPVQDPAWSWTPNGVIYCGVDGVLTQTPPATGNVRKVATAISATTLVVAVGETIALA